MNGMKTTRHQLQNRIKSETVFFYGTMQFHVFPVIDFIWRIQFNAILLLIRIFIFGSSGDDDDDGGDFIFFFFHINMLCDHVIAGLNWRGTKTKVINWIPDPVKCCYSLIIKCYSIGKNMLGVRVYWLPYFVVFIIWWWKMRHFHETDIGFWTPHIIPW